MYDRVQRSGYYRIFELKGPSLRLCFPASLPVRAEIEVRRGQLLNVADHLSDGEGAVCMSRSLERRNELAL